MFFQIRERIYSVTEVVTEELDDEVNPIIGLDKNISIINI